MATPVVEQVVAAFVARLEALDDIKVERERDQEVGEFPFLVVYEGDKDVDDGQTSYTSHTQTITVEGYVEAEEPADLGPARNALYARVAEALLADPSLGGLSIDVREGNRSSFRAESKAGKPVGAFTVDFLVTFWTKIGRAHV